MNPQQEYGYKRMLKEIFLSHPFSLSALIILSALGMGFSLATPLIMKSLIDDVFIGRNVNLLAPILITLSCIYIISSVSNYFSKYIKGKLDIIIFKDVSLIFFEKSHEITYKEFQKFKIGDLLSRATGNINMTVQIMTTIIPELIMAILGFILPFFILLSLNSRLTFIVMSPVFLFCLSSWYFGREMKKRQRSALDSGARLSSFLKEVFTIIPLTKVYGLEKWMLTKYNKQILNYYDTSINSIKISSLSSSAGMLIYGVPSILVLTFGSLELLEGRISLGTLTAFMGYVGLFFSPIQQLSSLWTNYKVSQAAFDRIQEVLLLERDQWGNEKLPGSPSTITFENVSFSYGNQVILKRFDATFKKGRNYLIGDNGSGKSTTINLLCGLYRPDEGRILINDQDISKIRKEELNNSISVVFSDSLIFDGTVYENIQIGNLDASSEEIIQAAKKAELHNFIITLPHQYETEVGESGLNLSSGEKQKIALARVILRNSPIIVFDEFTRSIDADSKTSIDSVIRQLNDKIIIIITHNMNDIEKNSNQVYLEKKSEFSGFNSFNAPASEVSMGEVK